MTDNSIPDPTIFSILCRIFLRDFSRDLFKDSIQKKFPRNPLNIMYYFLRNSIRFFFRNVLKWTSRNFTENSSIKFSIGDSFRFFSGIFSKKYFLGNSIEIAFDISLEIILGIILRKSFYGFFFRNLPLIVSKIPSKVYPEFPQELVQRFIMNFFWSSFSDFPEIDLEISNAIPSEISAETRLVFQGFVQVF